MAEAVTDAAIMDTLGAEKSLAMNLYAGDEIERRSVAAESFPLRLEPVPLSSSLPMLEHMGVKVFEELNYKVEPKEMPPVYVHDFGMSSLRKH